jgi:amino acid permease
LYIGSRTLYGLAVLKQTPRIFRKVTKWGVPISALVFCWLFTFLVFMNLAEGPQDGMILTPIPCPITDTFKQSSPIWLARQ